jgi:hypothetical protein
MKKLLAFAASLLLSVTAMAKDPVFSTEPGAIRGYDPVAYFTEGKAVMGDVGITHSWKGSDWRFASDANRKKFMADPEKYAPAYGGYCAYAVANGYTAATDPDAWSIVDDRLYLNYSASVKQRWKKNTRDYIRKANENWPAVLSK